MEIDVDLREKEGIPMLHMYFLFQFPLQQDEATLYSALVRKRYEPGDVVPMKFTMEYTIGGAFPYQELAFIESKSPTTLQACSRSLEKFACKNQRTSLEALLFKECIKKFNEVAYPSN